ncbi:GAF domain-containing protein [Achromobacter sp. NPDC058515]|uniref:GAF domain-containing protein n=1 Tax=Achromobacter sp. NPDC058515 TaxID=3346533 RepID=UPI003660C59B
MAAAIAAVKLAQEPSPDLWLVSLATIACMWLAIATGVRISLARAEDAKEGPDFIHEGLFAAVSTVHTMLAQYCSTRSCGGDIRATFHRVVPPVNDPEQIEQIINYVGSNGEGAGRHFPINAGITGRAIRKKTPVIMASTMSSEEQHRTELVNEWGYTEAQARRLMPGRFSAVAVPVLGHSGQHAVGALLGFK